MVTLHGNGTGIGTGDGSGTMQNNRFWSLSLSQTSVYISITFCTFHLIPVSVPVPFTCSVTKSLLTRHLSYVSVTKGADPNQSCKHNTGKI